MGTTGRLINNVGVSRIQDIVEPKRSRRTALAPDRPGEVQFVAANTLGAEIGIEPGDRIVKVNGHPLRDILDFQFYASVEEVILEIERDGVLHQCEVERDLDEPWGITFSEPTNDGIHICENACPFCFIKQIPKGMRRSLYVMDDDYRHSMLHGSFVTLTNLTESDWRRIEEQRLGPLHVSVHATNPELRTMLVGNPKGALIMEHLARLERAGIDYHAQLVLCPGVNDGPELDRSLRDLASLGPHLKSIAGVPVGLTRFGLERQSKRVRLSRPCVRTMPGAMLEMRRHTVDEALGVIAQAERWQAEFRAARGETFFHLGDEFYLMTGTQIPDVKHYDDFPQIEDGIGITRVFLDDARRVARRGQRAGIEGAPGIIACGTLIGPTMQHEVERLNRATRSRLEVLPVENTFFGSEINISGLLTGGELVRAFGERPGSQPVFISTTMISRRTNTLLDDMTLDHLKSHLRRDVIVAEHVSDVVAALRQMSRTAA
jgi:putative radical SAM enzyme (TIGR03279 family)